MQEEVTRDQLETLTEGARRRLLTFLRKALLTLTVLMVLGIIPVLFLQNQSLESELEAARAQRNLARTSLTETAGKLAIERSANQILQTKVNNLESRLIALTTPTHGPCRVTITSPRDDARVPMEFTTKGTAAKGCDEVTALWVVVETGGKWQPQVGPLILSPSAGDDELLAWFVAIRVGDEDDSGRPFGIRVIASTPELEKVIDDWFTNPPKPKAPFGSLLWFGYKSSAPKIKLIVVSFSRRLESGD